jgi:hypothetical protein
MKYRTVGTDPATRREVSVPALGAMLFGSRTDEKASFAVLDRYAEAGGTFVDTSDNYAFILYVLHTGTQWEHRPQDLCFGSGMTCWRRLRVWNEAGVPASKQQHRRSLQGRLRAVFLRLTRMGVDGQRDRLLLRVRTLPRCLPGCCSMHPSARTVRRWGPAACPS